MTLNLILALFWLIVSIGLFLYPVLHPEGARLEILRTGIPFAWMTTFLCGYNLLRWWLIRVKKREREVMDRISDRTRPRGEERNPDFDFSDEAEARNKDARNKDNGN